MKKGYHSTQKKYFNTVPRTAFLGLVLGYGIGLFVNGLIVNGFMNSDSQALVWISTIIGVGIGFWLDEKYYMEKDVPVEEIEKQSDEDVEQSENVMENPEDEVKTEDTTD